MFAAMMLASADRPLIFLDVDGPLIPFRARPALRRPPPGDLAEPVPGELGNPLVDRLDPADGRRLLALGCQLVWATTWMADANEVVSPRLGLPALPVVDFPDTDDEPARGLHWKTMFLTRWAAGRPFVWIDDETTDIDRQRGSSPPSGAGVDPPRRPVHRPCRRRLHLDSSMARGANDQVCSQVAAIRAR